jgi:TonB family protein
VKNNRPDIELIRRYLNGELDATAMYKLERQAQEDPLLMDMIQGMEKGNQKEDEANLADIHRLVSKRVLDGKAGKTTNWKTWVVAASLVFALSFGTFQMLRKPDPVLLARQSAEQIKADQPKIESAAPARVAAATARPVTAPVVKSIPALKKTELAKLQVKAPLPAAAPVREETETGVKPAAIASVVPGRDSTRAFGDPRDLDQVVVVGYGTQKKEAATAEMRKNDSDRASKALASRAAGIQIRGRNEQNGALNETVVIRGDNSAFNSKKEAVPVTGWAAYKKYLKENAISKDKKGSKVTVAFVINVMGTPDHIRIVKGINNELDQQAVQLIRNGPKWAHGQDNQSGEIILKIKFRDPVKKR